MSNGTFTPTDGVTLKEHLQEHMDQQQKLWESEHRALVMSVNSYRQTQEEVIDRMLEDIRSLRDSRNVLEGKADQSAVTRLFIITIIGLGVSILSLLLRFF